MNRDRKKEFAMMRTAEIWSKLSTCSRLKVGAVICSVNFDTIFSIGVNGGVKGQRNECVSNEPGNCGHYHAELNALIKPQIPNIEKILFVTHLPCKQCAGLIVNNGTIKKVYYKHDYRLRDGIEILDAAHIPVEQLGARKPKQFKPLKGQKELF